MTMEAIRGVMFPEETDEVFIVLITIDHNALPTPIRVSSDAVDTVSRGNTYTHCPFKLQLPVDEPGAPYRAKIAIDNVDRRIVQNLRTITTAAEILVEIVRASDPNTVDMALPDFELAVADYDQLEVSGELNLEDFSAEPFPAANFDPARFRGGF